MSHKLFDLNVMHFQVQPRPVPLALRFERHAFSSSAALQGTVYTRVLFKVPTRTFGKIRLLCIPQGAWSMSSGPTFSIAFHAFMQLLSVAAWALYFNQLTAWHIQFLTRKNKRCISQRSSLVYDQQKSRIMSKGRGSSIPLFHFPLGTVRYMSRGGGCISSFHLGGKRNIYSGSDSISCLPQGEIKCYLQRDVGPTSPLRRIKKIKCNMKDLGQFPAVLVPLISSSCIFHLAKYARLPILGSFEVFHLLISSVVVNVPCSFKHHYSGTIYLSALSDTLLL